MPRITQKENGDRVSIYETGKLESEETPGKASKV